MIKGLFTGLVLLTSVCVRSQPGWNYLVEDHPDIHKMVVSVKSKQLQGSILAAATNGLAEFELRDPYGAMPVFEQSRVSGTTFLNLHLDHSAGAGAAGVRPSSWLSGSTLPETSWKLMISEAKPMELQLNYTVGSANVNLSGLAIRQFKLHSGSADVTLMYEPDRPNLVPMDTLNLSVDWGSVHTHNLHLSRARHIRADISFGKLILDFREADAAPSSIVAGVGAGRIDVSLPDDRVPVRIRFNDSPLCRIIVPKSFIRVDDTTFISPGAASLREYSLDFQIDVALGTIQFRTVR
jgi:hypothetical protein